MNCIIYMHKFNSQTLLFYEKIFIICKITNTLYSQKQSKERTEIL